ncbi:MAG: ADP-glyceromanno-heptose 6-epimerase [Cytophagales bacterium]|nr:ADP-glyceromanno-heptose 6-epimerase [Cytophagales bacterium]MDW8383490.1 ADP-glyceromanno-heptose 6-epimerase [Flammeovirgaceae bacterium]
MIVITGAAGFIGSCMISYLNNHRFKHIIAVDNFSNPHKNKNLEGKIVKEYVDRHYLIEWIDKNHEHVEFILHIGARTDTTEFNWNILYELNLNYSQQVWKCCVKYQIPLIYASSAATYGLGELGYCDDETLIPMLKPLNPYGKSKNEFDKWAISQPEKPFFWVGLKFFNVYGPNEYHKGRMASVVFHAYHQIKNTGGVKLFRSHHPQYKDGEQMRDFIYVKDVLDVIFFLMNHRQNSGIYNLGTGKARTFLDLASATFCALSIPENISFIDTPEDIRDKYQYFTEADMAKLRSIGYSKPFTSLEEGITEYVQEYLVREKYL